MGGVVRTGASSRKKDGTNELSSCREASDATYKFLASRRALAPSMDGEIGLDPPLTLVRRSDSVLGSKTSALISHPWSATSDELNIR